MATKADVERARQDGILDGILRALEQLSRSSWGHGVVRELAVEQYVHIYGHEPRAFPHASPSPEPTPGNQPGN